MKSGYGRITVALLAFALAIGLCPALAFAAGPSETNDAGSAASQQPVVNVAYRTVALDEECTLLAVPGNIDKDATVSYAWQQSVDDGATWTDVAEATKATLALPMSDDVVGTQRRVVLTVSSGKTDGASGTPADAVSVTSKPVTLELAKGDGEFKYTGESAALYRLIDPNSCCHLYTPSLEEAEETEAAGWLGQGVAWNAPAISDMPAYRLYNQWSGAHFYTADPAERDSLVKLGWADEGISFYSFAEVGVPVFRLYNAYNGDHHFTVSEQECEDLVAVGWENEGAKFYGVSAGDPYSGTPDWDACVIKDAKTGVVVEGIVFAQEALKGNKMQVTITDTTKASKALNGFPRANYSMKKTDSLKAYDITLTLKKADGTSEQMVVGFGDLKLTFPVNKQFEGEATLITHVGTRKNGDLYVIGRTHGTVENASVSTSVNHLSEFIVAVGDEASAPAEDPDDKGKGEEDTEDKVAAQDMHRLYNPYSGEHFYTASTDERDYLIEVGWKYEGVGWTAPEVSETPVYRLYNKYGEDHHYTMDADERDALIGEGWIDEDIGWYSDDKQGTPLYRQYNPNQDSCNHNYTTSEEENDGLVEIGWIAEGIGWYGLSADSVSVQMAAAAING